MDQISYRGTQHPYRVGRRLSLRHFRLVGLLAYGRAINDASSVLLLYK